MVVDIVNRNCCLFDSDRAFILNYLSMEVELDNFPMSSLFYFLFYFLYIFELKEINFAS